MPRARVGRRTGGRSTTVRRPRPARGAPSNTYRRRIVIGRLLMVAALLIACGKLVYVQGFEAQALAALADQQRTTREAIPAERGTITDRAGSPLALSKAMSALYALPVQIKKNLVKAGKNPTDRLHEIAGQMHQVLGDQVSEQDMFDQLNSDKGFVYLVQDTDPGKAQKIVDSCPEIGSEHREVREYPAGSVASNIIGKASWQMDAKKVSGLIGLENADDNILGGKPGSRLVDTAAGSDDIVIPGTARDEQPATPGSDIQLTIDSDIEYAVQQKLTDYVRAAGAKDGSAVVLDAKTGQVYALANDKTFDPNNMSSASQEQLSDPAVSSPYEPGSVNKIVTAAGAIEYGVAKPETVVSVPGSIKVADRTIYDAWTHGTVNMTFQGVIAKSSNIGTLETAQKLGPDRFADLLAKFGLGKRTDVGLPGESAGRVPARKQWSGSTFGNLPIGQGLSMTVLQMAGMYQAIANDGMRVPPRIIKAVVGPDGVRHEEPQPAAVKVVSPETAKTVRDMMRAVVQDAPSPNTGTGKPAALAGYQISGKTGTAQQPDPNTGSYSDSNYWITFAGMLPADSPRFVVGLMLDAPHGDPQLSHSAAPLFHDIASYLAQRYQLPLSPGPSPIVPLQLP